MIKYLKYSFVFSFTVAAKCALAQQEKNVSSNLVSFQTWLCFLSNPQVSRRIQRAFLYRKALAVKYFEDQ